MLFWAVLGVNCVYLIAELIFNAQLINVASINSTPEQIENIEIFGRTLSTIGFSLLFIKLIYMSPFAKNIKIFLWVFVLLLAHSIFFIGQKELINHFAESTDYSQKEEYFNTFLTKKAMLGERDHGEKMIFFDDSDSTSSKVFFSTMGVAKNDSDIISVLEDKDNIVELAAISDARVVADQIYNTYLEFGNDSENIYSQYRLVQKRYDNRINAVEGEARENYNRYTTPRGRQYVFNLYESMSKGLRRSEAYAKQKMSRETQGLAWNVGRCVDMDCVNERIDNYRSSQIQAAKNYLKSEADTVPTFGFYEFCRFGPNNKPNSTTFMTVIENGKKDVQRSRNLLINTGMSKPNMHCTFNHDHLSNIYSNHFRKMVNEKITIENFNITEFDVFSESKEFRNSVVEMARREGVDLNLPKNWHYSDKKTFMRVATQDLKETIRKRFDEAVKDRIGVSIPLDLTEKEFMDSGYLQNMINDELNKEYGLTVKEDSADEFFENNREKLIKISGLEILDIDLEKQGGDIVKAMIVPAVAMMLSLVFFLLNGILFFRDILIKFIAKRTVNIIAIVSFLLIFIIPFFVPNLDEGYAMFINNLEENNFWLAFFYDWVLSWEQILYPIGNLINDSVLPFINKYISIQMLDAIEF